MKGAGVVHITMVPDAANRVRVKIDPVQMRFSRGVVTWKKGRAPVSTVLYRDLDFIDVVEGWLIVVVRDGHLHVERKDPERELRTTSGTPRWCTAGEWTGIGPGDSVRAASEEEVAES